MGIRQWLNEHPTSATWIFGAAVALALLGVVWQIAATRKTYPSRSPDSYFTADDGKTFFVASSDNIPPWDYKGRTAVRAFVFQCDGKKFVGYVERYTSDARNAILAGKRSPQVERFGRELKKPGDRDWVKSGDIAVEAKATDIRCPDGHGLPEAVEPE